MERLEDHLEGIATVQARYERGLDFHICEGREEGRNLSHFSEMRSFNVIWEEQGVGSGKG